MLITPSKPTTRREPPSLHFYDALDAHMHSTVTPAASEAITRSRSCFTSPATSLRGPSRTATLRVPTESFRAGPSLVLHTGRSRNGRRARFFSGSSSCASPSCYLGDSVQTTATSPARRHSCVGKSETLPDVSLVMPRRSSACDVDGLHDALQCVEG